MTYQEAIDWLLSFADFERSGRFQDRPDVAPMLSLLERLGNPHTLDPGWTNVVHLAGSKGKGSTAAMIEGVVRVQGDDTGLYTSPHLYSYCERIQTNGTPITEDRFAYLVRERLRPAVESLDMADRHLVTFDLLTALALLEFADRMPRFQVIETGLGGRVDSTNVFDEKDVVVITPISFEHTAILGETIERIAREKAAIIVPKSIVIMARQEYGDAVGIIKEQAGAVGAPVVDVAAEYPWQKSGHNAHGQDIAVESLHGTVHGHLPLLGRHQADNAATAVAAIDAMRLCGLEDMSVEQIRDGLASVRWPCRIEVVLKNPLVIVDGAHNRDSARRLAETLVEYFACDRALFVIGCGSDKDIDGLAEELAPLALRVIAVRSEHPRAMDPQRIVEAFERLGVDSRALYRVSEVLDDAIASVGSHALICVAGSLFVAAEARAHVLGVRT